MGPDSDRSALPKTHRSTITVKPKNFSAELKDVGQNPWREGTRPAHFFGYVTLQEREPEEILCRAKAEKSLQRRGHLRDCRLAADSNRNSGLSAFRNTKLGRASCDTRDYHRFPSRSRSGVVVRFHAIRNHSNRGPVFQSPDRTPTPGEFDREIDRRFAV